MTIQRDIAGHLRDITSGVPGQDGTHPYKGVPLVPHLPGYELADLRCPPCLMAAVPVEVEGEI